MGGASLEDDGNAIGRHQRDLRLDSDYRLWVDRKAIALPNRSEDDGRLDQGKRIPDAKPLSAAERIIGEFRKALGEPILPALRTELLRIREISGIAMAHPLAHQHRISPLHPVSAEF